MIDNNYFGDLPQALVEELLEKCEKIGTELSENFDQMSNFKQKARDKLQADGLLRTKASLPYQAIPTCCGVDGAYAIEKMLSNDIIATAAVAIEGLTPPSEIRHWNGPTHKAFVDSVRHDINSLPRGIMMSMEINIAFNAPYDIIMLDGSFSTPLIQMNQAINSINRTRMDTLSKYVDDAFSSFLDNYFQIVSNTRTDKAWIYLPKYSTKHELKIKYGKEWSFEYDDKAVLTQLLQPGELVGPLPIEKPEEPWHFNNSVSGYDKNKIDLLFKALDEIRVYYYRPCPNTPALRIEMCKMTAGNLNLVSKIMQCLEIQCYAGGMIKPYPLYMADRMVKSLSTAMPTFRQSATLQIAQNYKGDLGDVFFGMHGYRTEQGRN